MISYMIIGACLFFGFYILCISMAVVFPLADGQVETTKGLFFHRCVTK
jgi:hypothetical protein